MHTHTPIRGQQEMRGHQNTSVSTWKGEKDGHATWISVSPTHPKVLEENQEEDGIPN